MTHPHVPQSSFALKQRLLAGASAAVLVLAMSLAVSPSKVMAQSEIVDGDFVNPQLHQDGDDIVSDGDGQQDFGAIDVDDNLVNPNSITLTDPDTLLVFDSDTSGDATTGVAEIVTNFIIDGDLNPDLTPADDPAEITVNLLFGADNLGQASGGATLVVNGNLGGGTDGAEQGDNLTVSIIDGLGEVGDSRFEVRDSVNLSDIFIEAGDANGADAGSDMTAVFGNSFDDTFAATALTVRAGDADVDEGDGGDALVVLGAGSVSISGNVLVQGGASDGDEEGIGGNALLDVDSTTVDVGGSITIASGDAQETPSDGSAGTAEVRFASSEVTATAILFDESGGQRSTLTLDGSGTQIINADIVSLNGDEGQIVVDNTGDAKSVTFTGNVGQRGFHIDLIDLNSDETVTFQGNLFANVLDIDAGVTTLLEGEETVLGDGTEEAIATTGGGALVIGNGTTAATVTFQGNVGHQGGTEINSLGAFVVDSTQGFRAIDRAVTGAEGSFGTLVQTVGDANDDRETRFFGAVTNIATFLMGDDTVFERNVIGADLSADADVLVVLEGNDNALSGDITGDGALALALNATLTLGATGETSTVSIAELDGFNPGGGTIGLEFNNGGNIAFETGSLVTLETTIGANFAIGDFTMDDADTIVSINSNPFDPDTAAVTGTGILTLGAGTVFLGSNIGDGDTVFDFSRGDFVGVAGETTAVQLSANFTEGTIDFIRSANLELDDGDGFGPAEDAGAFEFVNTALTTFILGLREEGFELSNTTITIAAEAVAAEDTAANLGVTVEQAEALRSAVEGADEGEFAAELDALTAALNNGGVTSADAARAARTVGVQGETVGGGATVASQQTSQQGQLISDRLRQGRIGSAFEDSGFSGGDSYGADSIYSSRAPARRSAVWGQAFGGVASADGDALVAGYDASFGGAMIGVDGAVSEDLTLGAFGSYSFATVDGNGDGDAQQDANTYAFGVYAGYTGQNFYLDGFASYAYAENEVARTDFINGRVIGDYASSQFAVGLSGGMPFEVSSNVFVTPNASLTWSNYDADSYTEVGGGFASFVNPAAVNQLTGTIGARVHAVYGNVYGNDGTVFIPELRVALISDLIDDDAVSTAAFVGGGSAYQVTGTDIDNVGALVGVGLGLDNPNWSASLSYDADLRSDFISQTASAEFRWKF